MNKIVAVKFLMGDMIAELVEQDGPNAQSVKVRNARWIHYHADEKEKASGKVNVALPEFFFIPAAQREIVLNLAVALTRPVEVDDNMRRLYEAIVSPIVLPQARGIELPPIKQK